MDLNNIYEILNSFRDAIEMLKSDNEQLKERIEGIDKMYHGLDEKLDQTEHFLYDEILIPSQKQFDENLRAENFANWSDKYGERLTPLNDQVRAMEGDDSIDLLDKTFSEFYDVPEENRKDPDEYVEDIIKQVEERATALKKLLGLPEDANINVGEKEISAELDGEKVAEIPLDSEAPVEETEAEEPAEEKAEEPSGEEPEEDDPSEIAKFEEELRASLKK